MTITRWKDFYVYYEWCFNDTFEVCIVIWSIVLARGDVLATWEDSRASSLSRIKSRSRGRDPNRDDNSFMPRLRNDIEYFYDHEKPAY